MKSAGASVQIDEDGVSVSRGKLKVGGGLGIYGGFGETSTVTLMFNAPRE